MWLPHAVSLPELSALGLKGSLRLSGLCLVHGRPAAMRLVGEPGGVCLQEPHILGLAKCLGSSPHSVISWCRGHPAAVRLPEEPAGGFLEERLERTWFAGSSVAGHSDEGALDDACSVTSGTSSAQGANVETMELR